MPHWIRGDPWFSDGNIILVTSEAPLTAYRVHRGVLARHSDMFQDIFNIPQPAAGDMTDVHDGCPLITMHDMPLELANLINALYDGADFQNRSIHDFFYLAGILRLATKYFIDPLRYKAIEHLCTTWTYTLYGHDQMVETALSTPNVNKLTYPFVHPIHVLNLARETHVDIVLPSVFYFLSLYRLQDLMNGDHLKLKVEHPSRPSSIMSSSDIPLYTIVFQRRLDQTFEFVRHICGDRQATLDCKQIRRCTDSFRSLSNRLARSWNARTALLHYVVQVSREINEREPDVCSFCKKAFQNDCDAFREKIWKELPGLCDLPSWEELVTSDLPIARSRTSLKGWT